MTISASGSFFKRTLFPVRLRLSVILPVLVVLLEGSAQATAETSHFGERPEAAAKRDETAGRPRIVVVSGFLDPAEIISLERAIAAQLADLNVEFIFHHVDTMSPDLGVRDEMARTLLSAHGADVAFIICLSESRVDLRILRKTRNALTATDRPVEVTRGFPQNEALAVIIRATATTIIDEKNVASDERPSPKTASRQSKKTQPPSEPPTLDSQTGASKERPPYLFGEVGGALGLFSSGLPPWVGMTIGLGGFPTVRHFYLHVGYVAFSEVQEQAFDLSLTLKRHPVSLGAGYYRPYRHFFFGGGASLNLDYVTETISSTNPELDLEPDGASFHLALICYLQMGMRIRGPVGLFLNLGAEIPLRNIKYSINATTEKQTVIKPLPVQPFLKIGLRFDFF